MITEQNDRSSAAALSSLLTALQTEHSATADVSEFYSYRVVWAAGEQAYRGTVDELAALCWFGSELTAALAGIRNRAREYIAEARARGESVPQPLGEDRIGAGPGGWAGVGAAVGSGEVGGGVVVRVPPPIYAMLAHAAREQGLTPHTLALSRIAGSREVAVLEAALGAGRSERRPAPKPRAPAERLNG